MSRVVCVGLATLDTILAVPRHPDEDDRVVATELALAGGGPAATAAVTLSRLGVEAAFVGAVGDDAAGVAVVDGLAREGVDVDGVEVVAGGRTPQSSILVGAGGRAIVHYPGTVRVAAQGGAALDRLRGAAWVHVDHAGYGAVPRDAGLRISVDGGNPIEGLDLRGVELYAPSEDGLARDFGTAEQALAAGAPLVVVTRGAEGSAAWTSDGVHTEAPGVAVDAVSTLGAGDVFHGALLAALTRGRPLEQALAVANECAALSCRALDGRTAIPTSEEVAL
jgi:sugar/nucleoside kinase (ribokinase family)